LYSELRREKSIALVVLRDDSSDHRRQISTSEVRIDVTCENVRVNFARNAARTSDEHRKSTPILTVGDWSELAIGIDEKHKCWALTPSPLSGQIIPKGNAICFPMRGRQWVKLLEALAESDSGVAADVHAVATKLDVLPPRSNLPRDSRARTAELRRGHTAELLLGHQAWRKRLSQILTDLTRKFRRHISGPDGGDPVLRLDGDEVLCGFVVRYLFRDDSGHLRFGR
jgi:hypothetical protein